MQMSLEKVTLWNNIENLNDHKYYYQNERSNEGLQKPSKMPGNHNLGDMRPRKTESTKSYCYKKEMSAIFYLARMSKQIILEDVTTLPHCTQNS
jgi:hypothetical protein